MLDLGGIDRDARQLRAELEPDPGAVDARVGQNQLPDFIQRGIDVRRLPLHGLRARQGAQPTQDIRGADRLRGYLAQRSAHILQVRICPSEQPVAGVGVIGYGGQRLIELMCDACRHLADRGEARHVQQAAVQLASRNAAGERACDHGGLLCRSRGREPVLADFSFHGMPACYLLILRAAPA